MTDMPRVCVVGAGIMGLSTALQITETIPGVEVTITAEAFPPNTTSNAAGGYVAMGYFMEEDIPKDYMANCARKKATLAHCQDLYFSKDASETGVQFINLYRISKEEESYRPVHDGCLGFRRMTPDEIKMFPSYRYGYSYLTYTLYPGKYLPWLMKKLLEKGVKMERRILTSLSQVAGDYDVIVNCSGSGARDLVNDSEVTHIRGHNLKVKAPWVKTAVFDEDLLMIILPINEYVILGTTGQQNDFDPNPRQEDRENILKKCSSVLPGLKDVEIVDEKIGWRPVRKSFERIEREEMEADGRKFTVVHNYGHGKEGVTLHWGSAIDAARLVKESLGIDRDTEKPQVVSKL